MKTPKGNIATAMRGMLAGAIWEDDHGCLWRLEDGFLELWNQHLGWQRGWLCKGWKQHSTSHDLEVVEKPRFAVQLQDRAQARLRHETMKRYQAENRKMGGEG